MKPNEQVEIHLKAITCCEFSSQFYSYARSSSYRVCFMDHYLADMDVFETYRNTTRAAETSYQTLVIII